MVRLGGLDLWGLRHHPLRIGESWSDHQAEPPGNHARFDYMVNCLVVSNPLKNMNVNWDDICAKVKDAPNYQPVEHTWGAHSLDGEYEKHRLGSWIVICSWLIRETIANILTNSDNLWYPLVNVYITMENPNFYLDNSRSLWMAIFTSYVSRYQMVNL